MEILDLCIGPFQAWIVAVSASCLLVLEALVGHFGMLEKFGTEDIPVLGRCGEREAARETEEEFSRELE